MRKATGDTEYFAEMERESVHWTKRIEHILTRPFRVLFAEPMLMAITLYMSVCIFYYHFFFQANSIFLQFIYGCIYLLFEAYPIVFAEGHHLNSGESGLTFLPLFTGGVIGVIIVRIPLPFCSSPPYWLHSLLQYLFIFNPRYEKQMAIYAPRMVPPEHRLEPAFYGAPMFAISFLWFGWTSFPSISLWAPLMSGVPLGISVVWMFVSYLHSSHQQDILLQHIFPSWLCSITSSMRIWWSLLLL